MGNKKTDLEPDIKSVINRHEPVSMMEPLLIASDSRFRSELNDLAVDLAAAAAGFRRSLPDGISHSLADLVRAMNCYYSNLIEGHDTHPVDIERALKKDYSADSRKRNLQLEARAHISVQTWIDRGGLSGKAATAEGIREIHRRFGEPLPEELLWGEDPDTGERIRVIPGDFRQHDVKIGRHVSVSPGAVPKLARAPYPCTPRPPCPAPDAGTVPGEIEFNFTLTLFTIKNIFHAIKLHGKTVLLRVVWLNSGKSASDFCYQLRIFPERHYSL